MVSKQYLVSIQQRTVGQDAAGQPVETWTELAQAWADIRLLGGLETIKAGAVTAVNKASIRLHYRTDITNAMRVLHNGITYQVQAVLPDMARRRHVDLVAEVVS